MDIINTIYTEYYLILKDFPWVITFAEVICLFIFAWLLHVLFRKIILKVAERHSATEEYIKNKSLNLHEIVLHFIKIIPLAVIVSGIKIIPNFPEFLEKIINNILKAIVLFIFAYTLSSILNVTNIIYHYKYGKKAHSIKGYIQLIKLIIFLVTAILIVAELIDRSPVILLSGLGAMAAVLMLVFQDTLLSLVASIQISSSNMVMVGDWVEMPNLNADGEVIDIALHTVQIRNWDNTITTLPTRKFMTDPFKNWRGMEESGGRRIQRAMRIDQNTIRYLSEEELSKLKKIDLIHDYIKEMIQEIKSQNIRGILNIAVLCKYAEEFLKSSPNIHKEMTILVRQLASQAEGLPIEIYCFSNNTVWVSYERIKADIFNNLFAILPELGLRVYQKPSGTDFQVFVDSKFDRGSL